MRMVILSIRDRLDRFGVLLSGACALHCILSIVIVSGLGLGGEALLAPAIHEIGLAMAIVVGIATLGYGAIRHGAPRPLMIGGCGIALMTGALGVGHGLPEAMLTIGGVALVAWAHLLNLRRAH